MKKAHFCTVLLILGFILFTYSCQKSNREKTLQDNVAIFEDSIDYVIFGKYVGEFHAPWTISYKVNQTGAYQDTTDSYLYHDRNFDFSQHPLDAKSASIARKLVDELPPYLVNKAHSKYDCTQCYDLGGTYLEIKTKNDTIKYHTNCTELKCIDTLSDYFSKINETISKIAPKGSAWEAYNSK